MSEITDFYFSIAVSLWAVIKTYWFLSLMILLQIFAWIISLVNGSRTQ